jgi:hypothetical protein
MSHFNMNPQGIEYVDNILDREKYNGRVNIVEPPSIETQLKMQERISIKNKSSEYREALAGTWENNILSNAYFSKENVQIVQNGLRAGVYAMSENKFVIAPQNVDTLKIIMRSIYMQYAEHLPDNITGQISRLNKLVLDYAVPTVYNEATGYVKYMQDQSTLVVPLEIPKHHDREYKQLELKKWV